MNDVQSQPKKEKEIRLKKEFVNTTAPGEKKGSLISIVF
jgi:hypothetical protein